MNVVPLIPETSKVQEPTFEDFWSVYPRRVAKLDARRAWAKIAIAEYPKIIAAAIAWRKVWLARGELEFVPHPATWLNGERWEDELPNIGNKVNHVAHQPAKIPAEGERSVMPDAVRAQLANFRFKG